MYDSHMHTPLCRHATGSIEEYAQTAHAQGLDGIIVTCHGPMPDGLSPNVRMARHEFDEYLSLVRQAQSQWADRLPVLLGLECDYLPDVGLEPWLEQQAAAADYDYLLASVHPHLPEYRARFWAGDPVAYQRTYFDHLAQAAELGLHDALAHPDLVKNVTAESWRIDRVKASMLACLDRVARTGMAMELNTSGWSKTVPEQFPSLAMLREMAARSIPVVVGSDAHEPSRVGYRFMDALQLLESAGYTQVSHFIRRRRHDVPIAEARARLPGVGPTSMAMHGART